MPYYEISDLPEEVIEALPGAGQRERFLGTFNARMGAGDNEEKCFRVAYASAKKSTLPVGKALVAARRILPGWAWAVLNSEAFNLPTGGVVRKSEASLTDVMRIFSFAKVQKIRGLPANMGTAPIYAEAIVRKANDPALIMQALAAAFDVLPGWAFATLQAVHSPQRGDAIFVAKEKLEGGALDIFKEVYLPLLGDPTWTLAPSSSSVQKSGAVVIALGRSLTISDESPPDAILPHPGALLRFGDRGEVARKARGIKNLLDASRRAMRSCKGEPLIKPFQGSGVDHASSERDPNLVTVKISKANEEKQVVTGVVLAPFTEDSQGDVLAPGTIEEAAFKWLGSSRTIGVEHSRKAAGAIPVESYLVPYPTREDYKAAIKGLDHSAYRFKMGADLVTSGSWVLSTKLNAGLWQAFKKGELEAYSIGGYGQRETHDPAKIPRVKYLEVGDGDRIRGGGEGYRDNRS